MKFYARRVFMVVLSGVFFSAVAEGGRAIPLDSGELTDADKKELMEIFRLKSELGDLVWPGLSGTDIPIILYNESYEFLVGQASPPSPWQVVKGDGFLGQPYHRRPAQTPQAFAVAVGTQWAGSGGTLERMSRGIPFQLSREFHGVIMLHEVFHAFQATRAPQRFSRALNAYKSEERYPFKDPQFSSAWSREGEALADALAAKEGVAISGFVQRFLDIREERRRQIGPVSELISFEHEMEWLEGLAKYAEVRFYELAAARRDEPAYAGYRSGHPFWAADLARLRKSLGQQQGDLRFYLSGLAQALLLDRLSPGWKAKALGERTVLEDFLRAAVGKS